MLAISKCNSKVPFAQVNLTPIVTCPSGVPCAKCGKCYALKSYKRYPNVRKAWDGNVELWNADPVQFEKDLCAYLKRYRKRFFRWHSAGDIPDFMYLSMMQRVAKQFPKIQFLAFSKRFSALDVEPLDNLTIRFSQWGTWDKPSPVKAVYVPKGETAPAQAMVCPGSCKTCQVCWSKDIPLVAFHHH